MAAVVETTPGEVAARLNELTARLKTLGDSL